MQHNTSFAKKNNSWNLRRGATKVNSSTCPWSGKQPTPRVEKSWNPLELLYILI